MAGDRDEDGKYTEQYPEEEFLSAINTVDVASTQNIADTVGCSYDLAYRRLKDLERVGAVRSKEVRSAYIWFVE